MKRKKMSKYRRCQTKSVQLWNRMVLEQMNSLEDDRKCWRLVNGILFEKTKAQVVPELQAMI